MPCISWAHPWFVIPPQKTTLARSLWAAFTFHLNWLEAQGGYLPPAWDILWSLSVEEMFYLFFPLVCLAFSKSQHAIVWTSCSLLGFVLAGPFARTTWAAGNPIWQEESYLGSMDAIAPGCLTALSLCQRSIPRAFAVQIIGGALMLFVAIWPHGLGLSGGQ